ncbi:MAG: hypothetical protein U1E65_29655 [Myxococcota bacterium]
MNPLDPAGILPKGFNPLDPAGIFTGGQTGGAEGAQGASGPEGAQAAGGNPLEAIGQLLKAATAPVQAILGGVLGGL